MRENFINVELAIPRRLSGTWGLSWSLPLAMSTREEIAGALACGRKLTVSVLQSPSCAQQRPGCSPSKV